MKSCKVLDWRKVPKQEIIDHYEAWKVSLLFICCVFLFLWCFVACMWWGLFFFLHGYDDGQCWLDKNLALFGACDGGSANIVVYEQVFDLWEAKFMDLS